MKPEPIPRVLVDLAGLRRPYSGLGRYCQSLAHHLAQQCDDSLQLTLAVPAPYRGAFGDQVRYVTRNRLKMLGLKFFAAFDCWHATDQRSPGPRRGVATVRTVHDLIREQAVPAAMERLQTQLKDLSYLTFISETTMASCLESLALPPNLPHSVIRNGVELPHFESPPRPSFLPEGEFFFSIGEFRPRKFFEPQIELMAKFPETRLVLAGSLAPYPAYVERLQEQVRRLGLTDRVIFPGIVTDPERAFLFQNCRAFFMTSKKEGFGLPAVEALRSARPVFLSTHSSLPEVGGSHAFYWPDLTPEPMEAVLREALAGWNPEKARSAREYSLQFDWTTSARRYLEVYRQVVRTQVEGRVSR